METIRRDQKNIIPIFIENGEVLFTKPFVMILFTDSATKAETYVIAEHIFEQKKPYYILSFDVTSDINNEDRDAGTVFLKEKTHYFIKIFDSDTYIAPPYPKCNKEDKYLVV